MEVFPTLKGSWPWPWIGSYCIMSCFTHRPLPTCQISLKSKERFVDGRTYVQTDIWELRPTLLGQLRRVDLKNNTLVFSAETAKSVQYKQIMKHNAQSVKSSSGYCSGSWQNHRQDQLQCHRIVMLHSTSHHMIKSMTSSVTGDHDSDTVRTSECTISRNILDIRNWHIPRSYPSSTQHNTLWDNIPANSTDIHHTLCAYNPYTSNTTRFLFWTSPGRTTNPNRKPTAYQGRMFYFCPSFCGTWLWSWQ